MTVPRNVVVVLVFVALLLACAGYAAGRLHQWHRRRSDRDAAYREGYEIATRKTFSLAARIIGPRRDRSAVRGAAAVPPSPPFPAMPSPGTTAPPDPLSPAASPSGSATRADALADAPTANSPATDVPFATALESVARPIPRRAAARSRRFHSIFPKPSITPSAGAAPTPSAGVAPTPSAGTVPTPSAGLAPTPFASGAARTDSHLHPPAEVAAEFAVPSDRAASQTPKRTAAAAPQHSASDRAPAEAAARPPVSASDMDARTGRHLVPDELVRAATYRLSPDRVARAKVPRAQPTPADEGDQTAPTAVPKPRRHPADDRAGGPASA